MKKEEFIKKTNPKILCGIAHRGLHNKDITENGLNAFKRAIDNDFAFELDVHLTVDNVLIVCHDSNLIRTTGKDGIIEELTSKEIKENYKLLDGSLVPTFKEVLDLTKEKVPIVVELKTYKNNNKELAKEVLKELEVIKDKRNIVLIAFDPRALFKVGKKSDYLRELLVTMDGKHDYVYFFRHFFESVDLNQKFFIKSKVRRYSKKHFINSWTIENEDDLNEVIKYSDTVTFQNMNFEVVRNALKKKNNL